MRTQKLPLRLSENERSTLEAALDLSGYPNITSFIRATALDRANEILTANPFVAPDILYETEVT